MNGQEFLRCNSIHDIMLLRGLQYSVAEDQRQPLLDHFMDNFEMRQYADQGPLTMTNKSARLL
jgi:hypothetical protein